MMDILETLNDTRFRGAAEEVGAGRPADADSDVDGKDEEEAAADSSDEIEAPPVPDPSEEVELPCPADCNRAATFCNEAVAGDGGFAPEVVDVLAGGEAAVPGPSEYGSPPARAVPAIVPILLNTPPSRFAAPCAVPPCGSGTCTLTPCCASRVLRVCKISLRKEKGF